jgi:uncharacterized protein
MTVELRPLGVRCNLGCRYCYQDPQRDAEGRTGRGRGYDLAAMKAAAAREGGPVVLFGGEPLLLPLADLEDLLAWSFERHGSAGLQTNGVLIADEHIRLFRRYNVSVGVSMDGPGPPNDLRRQGSLARTRQATQRTWDNIRRLAAEYRPPGIIATLHRLNGTGERLGQLIGWLHALDEIGVGSVRLHLLEVDDEALRPMALTAAENASALDAVAAAAPSFARLTVDVLHDVAELMTGRPSPSCTWHGCDPYSTPAVRGVEGDGSPSNCGRTNKDGVNYLKAERVGFERYVTLARTPMADGGCQGCRFFLLCRGQCPGTATGGDWRNWSEHCAVWLSRFEAAERDLLSRGGVPVSLDPRRAQAEQRLVAVAARDEPVRPGGAGGRAAAAHAAIPAARPRLPARLRRPGPAGPLGSGGGGRPAGDLADYPGRRGRRRRRPSCPGDLAASRRRLAGAAGGGGPRAGRAAPRPAR